MRTVPTVVASSSAVAASALGLAFVRQENNNDPHLHTGLQPLSRRSVSAPVLDMTATTTYTVRQIDTYTSPHTFTFSSPSSTSSSIARQSMQSVGDLKVHRPSHGDMDLDIHVRKASKRSLQTSDTPPMSMGSARSLQESEGLWVAQGTQSTWLKRLSTFSSTEGSLSASPQPPSTAVSQSNGSVAFSNTGSTTPMFPSFSAQPTPPNKLVKRSSSIRSTKASSRIPLPTFKKPATSHERDATMQDSQRRPSTATSSLPISAHPEAGNHTWSNYFTPKLTFENTLTTTRSRSSSTSIPNPIKRIQPDRRYHPVLVSGHEQIRPVSIDFEPEAGQEVLPVLNLSKTPSSSLRVTRRFFSSPLPQRTSTTSSRASISVPKHARFDESLPATVPTKRNSFLSSTQSAHGNRSPIVGDDRSFPATDSTHNELPRWKRPPKPKSGDVKYRRKGAQAAVNPNATMNTTQNISAHDSERPSKRRDISGQSQRGSLHSRDGSIRSTSTPLRVLPTNGSSPPLQTNTMHAFAQTESVYVPQSITEDHALNHEAFSLNSPATSLPITRGARQSATAAEFTSSFASSDSDARYHDDDGFESPNDTLFDSIRTRATSTSSAGLRGPRIDALFDECGYKGADMTQQSHDQLLHPKFSSQAFDRPRHSTIEEEETMATPVRRIYDDSSDTDSKTFQFGLSPKHPMSSSPPEMPSIFRRMPTGDSEVQLDGDTEMWDFGETEAFPTLPLHGQPLNQDDDFEMLNPHATIGDRLATPVKSFSDITLDARNIFDWSEQQHLEKSPAGRSPPRPRTVHGKKDAENRGSRSVGRRAPSNLHIRSQSVPVAPETDGKRSQVVTNKFGTWGVGSKGVTEDWNEDFDFEEPLPSVPVEFQDEVKQSKQRQVSLGMHVPEAIQQQQTNVLANIGLLRDWGLLIEELKELRARAQTLDIVNRSGQDMWHEVDAMIDLADQESQDKTIDPRQSPPSSPTFDDSAFDEPLPPPLMRNSPRPTPKVHAEDIFDFSTATPGRLGPIQAEILGPRRPRKDSEAVAKSVIEALQQRKNVSDPTSNNTGTTKKVPFDTATLKRIVPYVHELRDKVKRSIREVEGLYTSPIEKQQDPSFSRIFHDHTELSLVDSGRRLAHTQTDHMMPEVSEVSGSRSPPDELAQRMELMTMG